MRAVVTVNGEAVKAAGMTVLHYLEREGYDPGRVVVEHNFKILSRGDLDNTVLQENDQVEILCFVGGG
ncbi:sulfur carrier protein ThiS [Fusibacillus kribbianus]|uniref:Sulfur carrier protein ThiS n=1 Tax=Fusibacillus kribbianus TaxID=3044208 RepID=A0AAP4BCV2_9FIRM|nr:sulfur carrier protein ThiS [Ruminococcus sp. YH-rum2234]MDI9243465.1 sulfur carrier protein ThiS [Ruminococcus sp. YH-rum2234]